MASETDQATMVTHLQVREDALEAFSDWQLKLHLVIATFKGFVSLEIAAPTQSSDRSWVLNQRFEDNETMNFWSSSEKRRELFDKLKPYLISDESKAIRDHREDSAAAQNGATQIIVTHVNPDQLSAYRNWVAKIHQAESKFPGFRRVYVQAPQDEKKGGWITMVQFDSAEHLDAWLNSKERQDLLLEGNPLIHSIESHRMASSFAGWFSPARTGLESIPPAWKQTMLILLVLFPIVMLEMKFISPLLPGLNSSLKTFILNAISVALLSWPVTPLAARSLSWWLTPQQENAVSISIWGTAVVIGLYLLEIALFWSLL